MAATLSTVLVASLLANAAYAAPVRRAHPTQDVYVTDHEVYPPAHVPTNLYAHEPPRHTFAPIYHETYSRLEHETYPPWHESYVPEHPVTLLPTEHHEPPPHETYYPPQHETYYDTYYRPEHDTDYRPPHHETTTYHAPQPHPTIVRPDYDAPEHPVQWEEPQQYCEEPPRHVSWYNDWYEWRYQSPPAHVVQPEETHEVEPFHPVPTGYYGGGLVWYKPIDFSDNNEEVIQSTETSFEESTETSTSTSDEASATDEVVDDDAEDAADDVEEDVVDDAEADDAEADDADADDVEDQVTDPQLDPVAGPVPV